MRSQREDGRLHTLRVSGGADVVILGDQKTQMDPKWPPKIPHLDAIARLQAAVYHEAHVPLTVDAGGVAAMEFVQLQAVRLATSPDVAL